MDYAIERKGEQHRVLLDLARQFGYIVISPNELSDMIKTAAAKRPLRVEQVDSALRVIEECIKRARELNANAMISVYTLLQKELKDEIALRMRDVILDAL